MAGKSVMANRRLLLGILAVLGLGTYALLNADETMLKYVLQQPEQAAEDGVITPGVPGLEPAQSKNVVLNPLRMSAEDLVEIVDRPLFNPMRAPRVEAPPPPPPEPVVAEVLVEAEPEFDPSEYTLLGVAASASLKTAMIRANKTDKVFHVSAGQKFMDLTVEAVDDREVTLRFDQNSYKLKLFENPGQQPAAQPKIQFQLPAVVDEDNSSQ